MNKRAPIHGCTPFVSEMIHQFKKIYYFEVFSPGHFKPKFSKFCKVIFEAYIFIIFCKLECIYSDLKSYVKHLFNGKFFFNVEYTNGPLPFVQQSCAFSLISEEWGITAAHCVVNPLRGLAVGVHLTSDVDFDEIHYVAQVIFF